MKNFVEHYTWEEFQLIEEVRSVLRIVRNNRFNGNFQPYQIRKLDSLSQLSFSANISNKDVLVDLSVRNLKLDYAIQIWEIAQDLTKKEYYDYLGHEWIKDESSIKKLIFTSKNRANAEIFFWEMLERVCYDKKIFVSERAIFKRHEHYGLVDSNDLRLDVCVDSDIITRKIVDSLYKQFLNNENNFKFEKSNQRFTFDQIKDYFIYMDSHLLSLLNAEDGTKATTVFETKLFESAEKLDIQGILEAISEGADVNSIDPEGETALTKVIKASRYSSMHIIDNKHFEAISKEIPDFTDQEKIVIAKKLLDLGADINLFGYDGLNGLQYTAYAHNHVLMKFLLDNGANPNINFSPEDGMDFITSTPLDTILCDFHIEDDDENMEICEKLLRDAGAK